MRRATGSGGGIGGSPPAGPPPRGDFTSATNGPTARRHASPTLARLCSGDERRRQQVCWTSLISVCRLETNDATAAAAVASDAADGDDDAVAALVASAEYAVSTAVSWVENCDFASVRTAS